jgi:hypothetical protein
MVWAKNGTPDTLGSAGDVLQITDLTAKKFNVFLEHEIATGNIDNPTWTFNNNTNSVYADRVETNGGTDATTTSQSGVLANVGNAEWDRFTIGNVVSISGEEKLIINFTIASNTAGAGNAPSRNQQVAKFVPSPDADITRVDVTNNGTGDFDTSSNISALGTD